MNRIKANDQKQALMRIAADLMPEDEKAISVDWTKLCVKLDTLGDAAIPEDERAEEISSAERELMFKRAKISTFRGMGHICGALDDRAYALVKVDENNKRTYVLCVDQGQNQPTKIEINQSLLFRLAYAGFNMNNLDKVDQKKVREQVMKLEDQVLNTWEGGNQPWKLLDMLETLYHLRSKLPKMRIMAIDERREFYERLKDKFRLYSACCIEKKSYFAIIPEYVKNIAKEMKMTEKEFVKKLNDLNLLYKQPSTVGYQSKVRVYDTTDWMVCVFKLEYFEELEDKMLETQNESGSESGQSEPQMSGTSTN